MLNNSLEEYKKLYSEYVAHAVNVHNYNIGFIENVGYPSGLRVRNCLKAMRAIEKRLIQLSRAAYNEEKRIDRIEKREIRARAREHAKAKGLGRAKKNTNNVDTPRNNS